MDLFFSKLIFVFSAMTLLFSLAACGQKGPLYIQDDSEMPTVDYIFDKDKKNIEDASTTSKTSNEAPVSNTDNIKP